MQGRDARLQQDASSHCGVDTPAYCPHQYTGRACSQAESVVYTGSLFLL
jgi:hypothetical protein